MKWQVVFTKQAQRNAKKLASSGLKDKAQELISLLETHPFKTPPSYEKLMGDLAGTYSRQHRLVYQV